MKISDRVVAYTAGLALVTLIWLTIAAMALGVVRACAGN